MTKAVVDCNVLASTLITKRGVSTWLFALWSRNNFDVVISQAIFEELLDILDRPHIASRITQDRRIALLSRLARKGLWTPGTQDAKGATPDPDDDMLVSAALEANAEFIVTWDKALLNQGAYQQIRFITPEDFIALLNQTTSGSS